MAHLLLSLLRYISVSFWQIKQGCVLLSLLAHLFQNILILLKIKEIPFSVVLAEHTCSAPCALTTRTTLHRSDLMLFASLFDVEPSYHVYLLVFSDVVDHSTYHRFWERTQDTQKLQDTWTLVWNGKGRFGQWVASAGARQSDMFAASDHTKPVSSGHTGRQSSTFHMFLCTVLLILCPQRVLHLFIGVLLNYFKCNVSLLIF